MPVAKAMSAGKWLTYFFFFWMPYASPNRFVVRLTPAFLVRWHDNMTNVDDFGQYQRHFFEFLASALLLLRSKCLVIISTAVKSNYSQNIVGINAR